MDDGSSVLRIEWNRCPQGMASVTTQLLQQLSSKLFEFVLLKPV
uniref:Uncharacterized protein n=1 Tax=Ciona savignyi TaxID=51511 RepID=H2ZEF8_CIOSA